MADTKITDLAAIAAASLATGDKFVVVDVSDTTMGASGTDKSVTKGEFDTLYQPLDSDLTAIAALSTTSFGRALLVLADAVAGRTALGLGTAATTAASAYEVAGAAAAAQAASQPLDSDLTAIAALATTTFGRSLLAVADAVAGRTALGLGTAATTAASAYEVAGAAAAAQAASQPLDSDLTAIAALTTTSFGRSVLAAANAAALQTLAGTVIGTNVQAFDADLSAIAALTSAADKMPYSTAAQTWALADLTTAGRALIDDASTAAQRTTLGLVIGTDVEAHDTDLTAIAALAPSNDDIIQRKAGAWTNRTLAQLATDLGKGAVNGIASLDGSGLVPVAQLPASTAPIIRATTGAPTVSATDQAGDLAFDADAGILYGPLTAIGTITTGHSWNTSLESSAVITALAPNASQTYDLPTGWKAENIPRGQEIDTQVTLVSGVLYTGRIFLPKGLVVSNLHWEMGNTSAVGPTHSWLGLYDQNRVQLATTSDQGSAAISSYTMNSLPIATVAAGSASSFTTTYSGRYYIGICVVCSGATPKLYGLPSNPRTNLAPAWGGPSSTGLTTPPAFPTTATAITFIGSPMPLFGVS